ncbi:MAG: helix-turn-helix domain-containing protein [Eggerthellaceae bacterium]|jgi:transcriptional regulator with XRE-family HTH domain
MLNAERKIQLGKRIREVREKQKLSQRQLALMMGNESHSYLSEVERGVTNPSFDYLCSLADALDVEISYFFVSDFGDE